MAEVQRCTDRVPRALSTDDRQMCYSLDSPLRSQDPRGGSDFLAPSRPRGRFLAFRGPFLRSVAAQKVSYRVRHFGRVFTFPLSGSHPRFHGQSVTVLGARSARFFKGFGFQAPENPKFSLACRGMKACSLRSGSLLSPWRGSRRSRFLNIRTS